MLFHLCYIKLFTSHVIYWIYPSSFSSSMDPDIWLNKWIVPIMTSTFFVPLQVLERLIKSAIRLNKNVASRILERNLISNSNFEQILDDNSTLGQNVYAEMTEQLLQMALIVIKLEKSSSNKNEEPNKNPSSSQILSKALFHFNEKVICQIFKYKIAWKL